MQKPQFVSQLEQNARRSRFEILTQLLSSLPRPIRILDVGGSFGFWQILDYTRIGEIHVTLLNRFAQNSLPPNFSSEVGDARFLQAYTPQDFDVVISNSVIGHVGCFEDQATMANEIKRIGKRYFVQTPNQHFPVDWRTLVPFFHYLPLKAQALFLSALPIAPFERLKSYSTALQWAGAVRNLTRREIRRLFPEGTLVEEKRLGLTKSFMVFHGFETPSYAH